MTSYRIIFVIRNQQNNHDLERLNGCGLERLNRCIPWHQPSCACIDAFIIIKAVAVSL